MAREHSAPALTATPRSCPQCGSATGCDTGLTAAPWTIIACDGCGFAYMTAAASYEDLAEAAAWSRSFHEEKKRRAERRPLFDWLDQRTRWRLHLLPRPETWKFTAEAVDAGTVVDIGCGAGGNLLRLGAGVTPIGIEIDREQALKTDALLKERGGRCIAAPALEGLALFQDDEIDAAMLNSFLEHETAPLPLLEALRRKLKPGGVAVLKTPNFASWNARVMKSAWCGIRIPDHVNYFTPASMKEMAESAGFAVAFPRLANLPTNDNFWTFLTKPLAAAQ
ncbi:MAG: class I SAM-dependent methyltransferase [Pseudomonadota bacterium]